MELFRIHARMLNILIGLLYLLDARGYSLVDCGTIAKNLNPDFNALPGNLAKVNGVDKSLLASKEPYDAHNKNLVFKDTDLDIIIPTSSIRTILLSALCYVCKSLDNTCHLTIECPSQPATQSPSLNVSATTRG